MDEISIVEFVFDEKSGTVSFILNYWILAILVIIFFVVRYLIGLYKENKGVYKDIVPVSMSYKLGGTAINYQIVRNYQNIEIAHRIYIELITRKAAIEIDKESDVIQEVYNSWYSLFQITRDELKKISGEQLLKNRSSETIITLLSDILNKGLRPHLTKYQAKFRKWYEEEIGREENKGKTPQEVQATYSDYEALIDSIVEVNALLISYAEELQKVIKGN